MLHHDQLKRPLMKNFLILAMCLLAWQCSFAQDTPATEKTTQPSAVTPQTTAPAATAPQTVKPRQSAPVVDEMDDDQTNLTLRERFSILKSKSQNYREYKVIKESVLDGVWKIIRDSLAAKDAAIRKSKQDINALNAQLGGVQNNLKQKEASMTEVQYASTHITVLGMDMEKGTFLTTMAVLLGALVFVVATVISRMKLMNKTLQEKKLAVNMVTNEYEDYKRKAMDKQTKLSRELQDERNKLASINRS
jgi:hypothetical protein